MDKGLHIMVIVSKICESVKLKITFFKVMPQLKSMIPGPEIRPHVPQSGHIGQFIFAALGYNLEELVIVIRFTPMYLSFNTNWGLK
jgi:hypothetical protein